MLSCRGIVNGWENIPWLAHYLFTRLVSFRVSLCFLCCFADTNNNLGRPIDLLMLPIVYSVRLVRYFCIFVFLFQKLVSSAVIGIGVGIVFALPLLVIATQNVIIGLLATGVIVVITVSVIGLIPLAGWKLGVSCRRPKKKQFDTILACGSKFIVKACQWDLPAMFKKSMFLSLTFQLLESLNLVLVVGLSVDYVVHLAEGYSRSVHPDRRGRLHDTLKEVGVSVLSGAVTTLGASMFLLFAQILFFTQFGLFMFGTIGFSILYALGLFTTVMGLIGPENHFGSLRPLLRKCCPSKQ